MNQRTTVVGLLLFVVLAFGGLIFYDVKYGHKFEKLLGKDRTTQNDQWKWKDDWTNKDGVTPPGPDSKQIAPPVDGPQLIAGSYNEALKKSGELGKPVLVFFTADWCSWCKKMKSETLPDAKVQAVMKNYVLVYVDTDKDRAPATKFGVSSLPSYAVTNYKEEKLKVDSGFKNADSFQAWLNQPSLFTQPKAQAPVNPTPPKTEPKKDERKKILRPGQRQPQQPQSPQVGPSGPGCPGGG